MTLQSLDFNESRQHRQYVNGVRISQKYGLDDQYATAILLRRALERNDKLDACYCLGRLHGLVADDAPW